MGKGRKGAKTPAEELAVYGITPGANITTDPKARGKEEYCTICKTMHPTRFIKGGE